MAFEEFIPSHDPNAGLSGPWTFYVRLDTGVSITSQTVTVVDSTDTPIPSPTLVVSNSSFGNIDGQQLWGVSFYLDGGTPGKSLLRCRYVTNNSPATTYDMTMRITVAST